MKLTKSLFLAFAGLGLFACSNEEVADNGGVQGDASISVKISDPVLSRAVVDYTTGTEVQLNTIKLVLTAQTGGTTMIFNAADYDDRVALLDAVNGTEFKGVRNPSKMEVYINTDKSSGWTTSDDFMGAGLAEPLYASSTTFTLADSGNPDKDGDGVNEYTVLLTPEHTMARLEFGGIAHVDTKEYCMFETITIDGVILDGVAGVASASAWDKSNLMSNTIDGDFTDLSASWPADNKCYAYNIAPVTSGELPILKVCFSNININRDVEDYAGIVWGNPEQKGYATVKNYKLAAESQQYATAFGADNPDGIITKFPAGYIYQVKSLEIPDEAIGSGWQGGEDIHVIATVDVSSWNIAQGTVEWN